MAAEIGPIDIGVNSGRVMTVDGPIGVEELGVTLTHEHILCDFGVNGPEPSEAAQKRLFHRPLTMDILGAVRSEPMSNRENQRLNDIDLQAAEVGKFAEWGGRSIVELTLEGADRDPIGLQAVSRRTGVNIVIGAGYYIEAAHPARLKGMSADAIADEIVRDLSEGIPGTGIRAGIIGEIGIDMDFTTEEEKSLRGACRASSRTSVPLSIHSPGGSNRAHDHRRRILDIVEEEGADIRHTVIDHVNIRPVNFDSQLEFAARGVFLGYDGISCDFDWGARGSGSCDFEIARDVKRLIDAGFIDRILLSHDIHLKIMTTRYGGNGYGHILRGFSERLRSENVTEAEMKVMLVENPRRLFSAARHPA